MKPLRDWIGSIFHNHPPESVLFRVDAGRIPGLSFGHLARCLMLSKVLTELYRTQSVYLMRDYPEGVRHARQKGAEVRVLPEHCPPEEEERLLTETVDQLKPEWLILDLPYPEMDFSIYGTLRERGVKILFIDDCRFITPQVDILLNSSVLAQKRVSVRADTTTRYLLGPEYFILDESLVAEKPDRIDGLANVLLTFGGSDPMGLTLKAVNALNTASWQGVVFRIVLGPGNKDQEEIRELTQGRAQLFQVLTNPDNIMPYLQGCDVGVCAGGRTLFELMYFKKKVLPIASAEHEAEVIAECDRQGWIGHGLLGWQPDIFLSTLRTLLYG